jgi:hypothetical protein
VPADAMTQFLLGASTIPIEPPPLTTAREKDCLPLDQSYDPNP